ncbi:MAG: phosphatase PAP2 family protein [Flavobacteriales bacterium]
MKKTRVQRVYSVNHSVEPIATTLAFGGLLYAYSRLGATGRVAENSLSGLSQLDVNQFDRHVFANDREGFAKAKSTSDIVLFSAVMAPGLLFIDRNFRFQWKDILTMYIQSQALNSGLYQLSTVSIDRTRPLSYYHELSIEERTADGTLNSFYSGHTSSVAVASFFVAKVMSDVHRLGLWKKLILYSLAAAPPAWVGFLRVKAGKHFRSDVFVGGLVGAFTGVLLPLLHKTERKLQVMPSVNSRVKGLTLTYKLG